MLPLDVCPHMLAHDSVLFCGDLNYRLARIEREMVEVHARYNKHAKSVCKPSSRAMSSLEKVRPGIKRRFFSQKMAQKEPEK